MQKPQPFLGHSRLPVFSWPNDEIARLGGRTWLAFWFYHGTSDMSLHFLSLQCPHLQGRGHDITPRMTTRINLEEVTQVKCPCAHAWLTADACSSPDRREKGVYRPRQFCSRGALRSEKWVRRLCPALLKIGQYLGAKRESASLIPHNACKANNMYLTMGAAIS